VVGQEKRQICRTCYIDTAYAVFCHFYAFQPLMVISHATKCQNKTMFCVRPIYFLSFFA